MAAPIDSPSEGRLRSAAKVFQRKGGVLRTKDAIQAGIHPRTLYELRDAGVIEVLSRGLYRLVDSPPLQNPDLTTVASRVRHGVICLISALSIYDLTTQIPHEIYVALPRGAERPRLRYPPLRPFWFTGKAYTEGITKHRLDGTMIPVYSAEKTLADCFKYRTTIGLDTVKEALRRYMRRGKVDVDAIMHYAEICRVAKIVRPYLEALL
jgi:predicted transcriptional regulator of viral defense system